MLSITAWSQGRARSLPVCHPHFPFLFRPGLLPHSSDRALLPLWPPFNSKRPTKDSRPLSHGAAMIAVGPPAQSRPLSNHPFQTRKNLMRTTSPLRGARPRVSIDTATFSGPAPARKLHPCLSSLLLLPALWPAVLGTVKIGTALAGGCGAGNSQCLTHSFCFLCTFP